MTEPVTPSPITSFPPAPQPTDTPAVFDQRAAAFVAAQVTAVPQFNDAASDTYQNALAAAEGATSSAASAVSAAASAEAAASASNFKGVWGDLSGPLNKPATVKHEGRFWLLLENLTNVATAEPGVSPAWTAASAGSVTVRISSDTTATPGVYYVATTPGITLTVPSGWLSGDMLSGRNASGGQCFVSWGGNTLINDVPESPMRWPALGRFETINDGSTFA